MSAILTVLFLIVFIAADFARRRFGSPRLRREKTFSLPAEPKSEAVCRKRSSVGDIVALFAMVSLGMGCGRVLTGFFPGTAVLASYEEQTQANRPDRRPLEASPSGISIERDLATLRSGERLLTDRLQATDAALKLSPGDTTLLRRKNLIVVLLANPGGTGISDRLAAYANAREIAAPPAVYRAMANLHNTAESLKTGTFAYVAKYIGLTWNQDRGFAMGAPFIWGRNGWVFDART